MKTKILSKVLIIVLIAVVVFWGAGLYYYLPISNIKPELFTELYLN